MSRFFFDDRQCLVDEAIEGLMISTRFHNLVRISSDPAIRIVARNDWDKSKVALISGGGSGHEPAHVGFVGKGMLTAAVCGDIFASPGVDAVFNAIVAVTGEKGCLLIVKNYTGDRLNFGLAAEKAKKRGLKVEMVIVGDDISLPDNKQPRGIAGVALVHKIAGYAAQCGQSLSEVYSLARQACSQIFSMGVAIQSCHLPGSDDRERINVGQAELGLGIHGEPGAKTLDTQNSRSLIATLVGNLQPKVAPDARLAVLVNNLGGTSSLEMAQLTSVLMHSAIGRQIDYLIGPASQVSALDMKGFSLSLVILNETITEALLADVSACGWQVPVKYSPAQTCELPPVAEDLHIIPSSNSGVSDMVACITGTLIALEQRLNALDAKVGDGDTGSTFAGGARDIAQLNKQHKLPLNDDSMLLMFIGERLATVMGGSSGVLMSIFFTAAGQQRKSGMALTDSLLAGLVQMKRYGGAEQGDRTLIDALQPALEALKTTDLQAAKRAAKAGAAATAKMHKARAGRSAYVNGENLSGVADPGAVAVAEVFSALAQRRN